MSLSVVRACLAAITLVAFLCPAAAQERPRTLADAVRVIDSYRGRPVLDLPPEDLEMLLEARRLLVDLAPRIGGDAGVAEARAVRRILGAADAGKLGPRESAALVAAERFLKDREGDARRAVEEARRRFADDRKPMAEAVRMLEEVLHVPADGTAGKAPERTGAARDMLGIWTLRRVVRPTGRAENLYRTVVVLDRTLVQLDSSGEVQAVSPYQLGRYGERLNAIDFAPFTSSSRTEARGIFEADDARMRIAFAWRLVPRPEVCREPSREGDPALGHDLWEFERAGRLTCSAGPARERKEMTYEEARKALADLEAINGAWETPDGETRLTFDHGQVDSVIRRRSHGRSSYRLNPHTAPGVMEISPRALGLSVLRAPRKFVAGYRLDGDTLVLTYADPDGARSSPNPFDAPNPFERPDDGPGAAPKKDNSEKVTLTLKRAAQKK